jgi:DNA repair exonuclease SbcCD ATPase subunit
LLSLSDSSGNAPFGASELRIRLEKNKKLQESAADILSVLRRPSSGETSGVPTLVLPDATHADQRTKRNIVSDLEDIQIALRAVPLEKDDLIGKIEYNLIAWVEVYQGSPPADLQALMGHLKALVARLEGDSPSPGKATSLISQARPLLQQLEAACTETSDGIARLKADRPRLEKRVAELEKARAKQQACVAKYDELASEARRREKEVAGIAATYNIHVQAHDEAVATFTKEADALAKSRDEMATFLGSNDEEETNGSPPDGGLPEVQMIMSYKLEK